MSLGTYLVQCRWCPIPGTPSHRRVAQVRAPLLGANLGIVRRRRPGTPIDPEPTTPQSRLAGRQKKAHRFNGGRACDKNPESLGDGIFAGSPLTRLFQSRTIRRGLTPDGGWPIRPDFGRVGLLTFTDIRPPTPPRTHDTPVPPRGTTEDSPPFQRWVSVRQESRVPQGRHIRRTPTHSSLPIESDSPRADARLAGGPSGLILAGWVFCLLLTSDHQPHPEPTTIQSRLAARQKKAQRFNAG